MARSDFRYLITLAALVTSTAYAQKVGECLVVQQEGHPVAVQVNQRQLGGQELALYLAALDTIDRSINTNSSHLSANDIGRVFSFIRSLPDTVGDDARDCLRIRVEDKFADYCQPGDPLLLDLLRMQDPDIARGSVNVILNQDTQLWFEDRQLRRHLRTELESRDTDPELRISILYLFAYANRFAQVRGTAMKLIAQAADPALARGAAQAVMFEALRNNGYDALVQLFDSSAGTLRQEAAIMLIQESSADLTPRLRAAVSSELGGMLLDERLPPETRGEAIEACGELVDDPQIRTALLLMLDRKNWFFGVNGTHAKEHSLIVVITALAPRQEPEVRNALSDLQDELSQLDSRNRADVERVLRNSLR